MSRPRIEPDYRDQSGYVRHAPPETVAALETLLDQEPESMTAPIVLRHDGGMLVIPLPFGASRWHIALESGGQRDGALDPGQREIRLPEGLPLGYHRLTLLHGASAATDIALVIAPTMGFMPDVLGNDGRVWGLTAQLYGLRSARNWGIGDFTDLADLITRAAAAGASLIGINPVHALFFADPARISPYAPSSRDFLNWLYIDPEAIPDFAECEPARRLRQSPEFMEKLGALRAEALVDYRGVATLKGDILPLLHRSFRALHLENERDKQAHAFRAFQQERGKALRRFATFEALHEHLAADWPDWPPAFRDPDSDAVKAFAERNAIRIEFFEYLQFQAARQLAACAARAEGAGMPIGLYLDIAVGVDRHAAATWTSRSYWVPGWHIGAPPDALAMQGQDWGLPPPHPMHMNRSAYAGFRTMLRAAMTHGGAIRLDHILGLMRLFWLPAGGSPRDGAYVHYPFEDLLSILALESRRNSCLLVGEDLGTVPEGFGDILHRRGILSYRILYFERGRDGRFLPPEAWERRAVAAVSTHDLPTLAGYWTETDIVLKASLELLPDEAAIAGERQARQEAREALSQAIAEDSLSGLHAAVHRLLGRTRSMIAIAQLEDLAGMRDQANLPGTVDIHPNWRRKLPCDLATLFADPQAQAVLTALREARPMPASSGAWDGLRLPTALYRLQFNAEFTFRDATALIPYLDALGISHIYASSYLKARPGSTHGYDISDHNALDPEIGTQEEFDTFCDTLRRHGMGQILDFIPNHMGIGKADNSFWLDVLEWGQDSPFATFFDINWQPRQPALRGRVLVPVLGGPYGDILERGEIALHYDPASGTLSVWYADHRLPLRPEDYAAALAPLSTGPIPGLLQGFGNPTREEAQRLKQALARLTQAEPRLIAEIDDAIGRYRGRPGDSDSFVPLHMLLEQQHYRLAYWRVAADEINFRRFFDVNELAALRMERPEVFEHTHRFIGRLIGEGTLQGLRLDHLDGLYDPAAYLHSLQHFAAAQQRRHYDPADPFYVVAEKILAPHEALREDWPIAGTTGYEFIAQVNGLLIDPQGERILDRGFRRLQPRRKSFEEILYECKLLVIETQLASELNALASDLDIISEQRWNTRDYTLERLREGLRDVVAYFPVYRSYISARGVHEEDRRYIDWAVARARKAYMGADPEIFTFIHGALTTDLIAQEPAYHPEDVLRFAMRFQQYTGPVAAKALEDTAFYRFVRLIALNEVGSDPTRFGVSPQAFHHAMQQRVKRWPHALNATATHDTKHGEDARARLDVLSELAESWDIHLRRWLTFNRQRRHEDAELTVPTPADESMIYQILYGAWPPDWPDSGPLDEGALREFTARIKGTVTKSLREAKSITSWYTPNAAYESGTLDFLDKILDVGKPNLFLDDLRGFVARTARYGMLNGLSQLVLKLTAPGIPDCYQGTELWDHSMVDPDNRRPISYAGRFERLAAMTTPFDARGLLGRWQDGEIKLAILTTLLRARRAQPGLFLHGSYEPADITGAKAPHALAFLRRRDGESCLVVVGRLYASLMTGTDYCAADWDDTALALPDGRWLNVLTGRSVKGGALAELLEDLPVGVFRMQGQCI